MKRKQDDNVVVVTPIVPQPAAASIINTRSIPQLLAARQVGNPAVTPTKLSSVVAWNVHRLQNMIVAVGPGTPAATYMNHNNRDEDDASVFSSSSSSSSLHAMDEQDDEDSNEDMCQEEEEEKETSDSHHARRAHQQDAIDTVMEQVLMDYLHPYQ